MINNRASVGGIIALFATMIGIEALMGRGADEANSSTAFLLKTIIACLIVAVCAAMLLKGKKEEVQ
jgi:hypothetical protein